ncbi:MAG: excinuclease ABC subunit UvrA [Bacteroidales bacterium]|nr:excinuclease ABC subunit UvrA [Bacteroidales bacterium]
MPKTETDRIIIRGARVNNLKNVSLEIPRDKFVVITGVSGSGKSSLAFDTLFAEGQRRFAQSLSSYARQFLGRMNKPDVDSIEGIPPAVAIEQRVNIRNPRSTVATTTEIYDFIRLVFARIGRTYSPVSGREVRRDGPSDVLSFLDSGSGTAYLLAFLDWDSRDDKVELMLGLKEKGYSRLWSDGPVKIDDVLKMGGDFPPGCLLLIDRVRLESAGASAKDPDLRTRLLSSTADAFRMGDGRLRVRFEGGDSRDFNSRFELDGLKFRLPDEYLFSFNSPLGACPNCGGLGKIIGVSEDLVVPDKTKSIYDGCIACWRGEKMGWFRDNLIRVAGKYGIPVFKPYCELTGDQKARIWEGDPPKEGETYDDNPDRLVGINEFFAWVETQKYKIQYKYMLSRFSGRAVCPECRGSRLRKEALWVKVGGKTIHELLGMNVRQAVEFFSGLELSDYEKTVVEEPLSEILSRLRCIDDVGLGYLTLNRACNTLSGGESQRVNLVTALGSSLVGSMYILDEPSIGLHPRDTERLINVLKRLRDLGNTVIVVEHDEDIIRAADVTIELGPAAGRLGGEIVPAEKSLTAAYLDGRMVRYRRSPRRWNYSICVEGAREHNLKDINVRFPLGVLTVVTGVSGSGKSTLVGDILYPALFRKLNDAGELPGTHKGLSGNLDRITRVEFVDQNPIGRSSRSNAATYLKLYDDIRQLMASQQAARINGFGPNHFSFNTDGGRCPECQGEGIVKIEMQFMADVTMVCQECGGKRFRPEILEVRYRGKNIDDILNMSVDEAADFFETGGEPEAKEIARKLQPLSDVGLGYIKLGQSSSTLSGGESQRIKLAYFLAMSASRSKKEKILFIFDEPTTGLHFYDVEKLLKAFDALLDSGHSVLVVEHNTDVIRNADWVIDLGPEAGDDGGRVVFEGTPAELSAASTHTARYL